MHNHGPDDASGRFGQTRRPEGDRRDNAIANQKANPSNVPRQRWPNSFVLFPVDDQKRTEEDRTSSLAGWLAGRRMIAAYVRR